MNRIFGIDFGLSKVGISVSDPNKLISFPLKVIRYKNIDDLINEIIVLSEEKNVNIIVLGYPLSMNFKKNDMTKRIEDFKVLLEEYKFKVFLQDERLSSESAKKTMIDENIKIGHNKEKVDLIASTIILQTFLDKNNNAK
tara:strand:+ start:1508 stop:1927 length:420 start_codon:yes stop_codon:yes gene_type:complete